MYKETYVINENARNSKLLALFGTLEEREKDLVINFAESLVESCESKEKEGENF